MEITKENIKELVGRRFGGTVVKSWYAVITKIDNEFVYYTHYEENGKNISYLECEIDSFIKIINDGNWVLLTNAKVIDKETQPHYDNTNGSLYLFAHQHGLNFWEADAVKRIVRCRKKGEFESDIKKTIAVLELYLKEYENTK